MHIQIIIKTVIKNSWIPLSILSLSATHNLVHNLKTQAPKISTMDASLLRETSAVVSPHFFKFYEEKYQKLSGSNNLSRIGKISVGKESICSNAITPNPKDGDSPSKYMQSSPVSRKCNKPASAIPTNLRSHSAASLPINMSLQNSWNNSATCNTANTKSTNSYYKTLPNPLTSTKPKSSTSNAVPRPAINEPRPEWDLKRLKSHSTTLRWSMRSMKSGLKIMTRIKLWSLILITTSWMIPRLLMSSWKNSTLSCILKKKILSKKRKPNQSKMKKRL